MEVKSILTSDVDPFRAGIEIGEGLKELNPELIIIFTCLNYEPFEEFIEGIESSFEDQPVPLIIGGTGDGHYETSGVNDFGASAIGINSNGKIKFFAHNISVGNLSTVDAIKAVASEVKAEVDNADMIMCLSDFHLDGFSLTETLNQEFSCPVFGGFLGNGRQVDVSYGFLNKKIFKDSLCLLAWKIEKLDEIQINIENTSGWCGIGPEGIITQSENGKLIEIDNISAESFLESVIGKSGDHVDKGVIGFRIQEPGKNHSYYRSISNIADENIESGSISLYGGVKQGSTIQLCKGEPEKLKLAVNEVCHKIKESASEPVFGIVVSCAGRKWLLGQDISHEVNTIFKIFEKEFPLVGFPSYGEISPLDCSEETINNCFHNVTYVIMIVSQKCL